MNARTLLNNEIAELMEIDANDKTIQALRSLDALLADMANEAAMDELIDCDFVRAWVERAAKLGYVPEDK